MVTHLVRASAYAVCAALAIGTLGCATSDTPLGEPQELDIAVIDTSGSVIDCAGMAYNRGKPTELRIRSSAARPVRDVVIRNCKLRGAIRTVGLGRVGEAEEVRLSSLEPGHTRRAQDNAPARVLIQDNHIEALGHTPIYAGPGTTDIRIERNKITGWSNSVAIYFDAESATGQIRGNLFNSRSGREAIAIDGSAFNEIIGNDFIGDYQGGIFLYRNCGEGGTIRHQTPSFNLIRDNTFKFNALGGKEAIHVNSRNGNRHYCDHDKGKPFGSSFDDRDLGKENTILKNFLVARDGERVEARPRLD